MQKEDVSEPEYTRSPRAAAHYIATLSEELARIARRQHLDSLAYILDMARLEANQIADGSADA